MLKLYRMFLFIVLVYCSILIIIKTPLKVPRAIAPSEIHTQIDIQEEFTEDDYIQSRDSIKSDPIIDQDGGFIEELDPKYNVAFFLALFLILNSYFFKE